MKNEPQFKTLVLDRAMQFSVGAETKVASVNVKLSDITSRDLDNMHNNATRRDYAQMHAQQLAYEIFGGTFGRIDKALLQIIITHTDSSVTFELWQRGPERITVPVDVEGK